VEIRQMGADLFQADRRMGGQTNGMKFA